jgi:hypothetical protein
MGVYGCSWAFIGVCEHAYFAKKIDRLTAEKRKSAKGKKNKV